MIIIIDNACGDSPPPPEKLALAFRGMRFKIAFGVFSDGFLGFQNMCFCRFRPFKGGLGRPFWHSCGAWGRTWALGKDLWALLAFFCDLWGAFLASLGGLMADIGCLWASFGPSLGDFDELWGSFLDTLWRHFGHPRTLFAYIG